jgi:3-hydroxyethyl bacteriochlorophyllide a dehydrogenase
MNTLAVVLEAPERLVLSRLDLSEPEPTDVVVDMEWSGISTGTERLLYTGRMPPFPGMGYPLVPGYESVGRITAAGPEALRRVGERVFVPGARCYGEVRGLFGGAASRVVVAADRVTPVGDDLGEEAVLLALAGTAWHAIEGGRRDGTLTPPDLIVGHGVLGRLLARLSVAIGGTPVVWELNADRARGAEGYQVLHPDEDQRRDYRAIYDVSGDSEILDKLVMRLAPMGEIVLAGFYSDRVAFTFPMAFMKEARIRIAAEWKAPDLLAVREHLDAGRLSLGGLITHRVPANDAASAYDTAFTDPACLKMILDWRACS